MKKKLSMADHKTLSLVSSVLLLWSFSQTMAVPPLFFRPELVQPAATVCPGPAEGFELLVQDADADRGCCQWKDSKGNKCSYTNRGYCRKKAEELQVQFEFHKDKTCQTVGGCPAVTPP